MLSEYVEKIMRNGICNFAKKSSKSQQEVQLLIIWDAENELPKYKKLVNGEPSQYVTFNEILDVKFDMLNRGEVVGQFITRAMDRYSKELGCSISQVYVLIALESVNESEDQLKIYLYRGKDQVKQLELEQLLM